MREMNWPELPDLSGEIIARNDLRVTGATAPAALLISGDLDAALAALAPGAPMLGLGADTQADGGAGTWAARIARDRALLVGAALPDVAAGWHAGGYGISQAGDLWRLFAVAGSAADRVIAEGTSADITAASPSAAVLFAGQTCLLLRQRGAWLIGAETPRAWALATWLKDAGG